MMTSSWPSTSSAAADDRLDAQLAARLEEAHRAVDAAAVGDRERGHLELGGPQRQLKRMRAAVQEREVGVAVQLDVGRRHHATVVDGARARR